MLKCLKNELLLLKTKRHYFDVGSIAHNTLCCGIPNALRRNNPYNDLQSAEYYKTILKQIKDEWKSE